MVVMNLLTLYSTKLGFVCTDNIGMEDNNSTITCILYVLAVRPRLNCHAFCCFYLEGCPGTSHLAFVRDSECFTRYSQKVFMAKTVSDNSNNSDS